MPFEGFADGARASMDVTSYAEDYAEYSEATVANGLLTEDPDWECQLFGCGEAIVLHPGPGQVPNWFWRWMQYLCFGNKWIKRKDRP